MHFVSFAFANIYWNLYVCVSVQVRWCTPIHNIFALSTPLFCSFNLYFLFFSAVVCFFFLLLCSQHARLHVRLFVRFRSSITLDKRWARALLKSEWFFSARVQITTVAEIAYGQSSNSTTPIILWASLESCVVLSGSACVFRFFFFFFNLPVVATSIQ